MSTKILFIDRDGTLINEAPPSYQINSFNKLVFYPEVFYYLRKIATEFNYLLVMISNQDGLGTELFEEKDFWPVQNFILDSLKNEKIIFKEVLFDYTTIEQHAPTRKPGTGLLKHYINNSSYNLLESFVIGDRITDMQLAQNLGCKGFWLNNGSHLGLNELTPSQLNLLNEIILTNTPSWKPIYEYLKNIHSNTQG